MIHIKLFEAFDDDNDRDKYWDDYLDKLNSNLTKSAEESKKNWDDYFKSIDYDTAADHLNNMVSITQEEFDDIKLIFGDVYDCKLTDWRVIDMERPTYPSKYKLYKYMLADRKSFTYRIWRLEDEWYIVEMRDNNAGLYYLCDQLDGLKALLNKTAIKE